MKSKVGVAQDVRVLAAYLDGEVTASEAVAIEGELAESPVGRRRLAELREMRDGLARPIPNLEAMDLVPGIARAIAAPAPVARRRLPFWAGFLTAGVLATSAAFVLWPRPSEFHAKSAAPGLGDEQRWAGIQAYRVGTSGAPQPLGEHMRAGDALVFSYTNLGPRPFEYLMIFAVDASGEVRWFFPAYENPGTNPVSIALDKGKAEIALGEAVRHDFAHGMLTIYALFSHAPLHVLEVESAIGGGRGAPARLPFASTLERRFTTQIDP